MKTMKRTLAMLFVAVLPGCMGVPITSKNPGNNKTYTVEYLFEYDGCKVYRFYDRGGYVNFTNCKGDVTSFGKDSVKTHIENRIRIDVPDIQTSEITVLR